MRPSFLVEEEGTVSTFRCRRRSRRRAFRRAYIPIAAAIRAGSPRWPCARSAWHRAYCAKPHGHCCGLQAGMPGIDASRQDSCSPGGFVQGDEMEAVGHNMPRGPSALYRRISPSHNGPCRRALARAAARPIRWTRPRLRSGRHVTAKTPAPTIPKARQPPSLDRLPCGGNKNRTTRVLHNPDNSPAYGTGRFGLLVALTLASYNPADG